VAITRMSCGHSFDGRERQPVRGSEAGENGRTGRRPNVPKVTAADVFRAEDALSTHPRCCRTDTSRLSNALVHAAELGRGRVGGGDQNPETDDDAVTRGGRPG